jgi:hypothetical protein
MIRIFGSLVGWISPERLLEEVAGSGPTWQDFVSMVLGSALAYAVLVQMLPVRDSGSFISSFMGGVGIGVVNLLWCLGITWTQAIALSDHKVDGQLLGISYGELLACNLHVFAVLPVAAFVAFLGETPLLVILTIVAIVRTTELQARALQHLGTISYGEAIKAAVVLMLIQIGPLALIAFLV